MKLCKVTNKSAIPAINGQDSVAFFRYFNDMAAALRGFIATFALGKRTLTMRKTAWILALALFALSARAQESQTVYNFLRLPMSAHAAAVGGDNITLIEDDGALVFNNPALLTSVTDKTIGFDYMNYMSGVNMLGATFNKVLRDRLSVGGQVQYINYGSMKETDADGRETGTFSAKDIALGGTVSYLLTNRIAGGVTLRMVNSYIGGYSSFAVGVDLGLNYYDSDREWSVSLVAKNLGGQLKAFDEDYESMPIDVQLGVSKRLLHTPFRLSGTLVNLNHWEKGLRDHFVFGADVLISDNIWLGLGYNSGRNDEMSIDTADDDNGSSHGAGLSLGAGLNTERFKVDVAWGKYHVSSSSILISLAYTL